MSKYQRLTLCFLETKKLKELLLLFPGTTVASY